MTYENSIKLNYYLPIADKPSDIDDKIYRKTLSSKVDKKFI